MTNHKKMLDREAVRSVIQQWNANRLDLFALSEPDENLLFHGVMRFYFQDAGQKVATKCIRVASDATVADVIDTLIEKFRPDMRMLSVPNYALYEVHANGEERRLNPDEKPLLVQLNWHIDDREGRFLLKNIDQKTTPIETTDMNFKRKLSKREKKEQKKKEKLAKLYSDSTGSTENDTQVAGKLYTELPETSFTRSISNPEAVMRRRRQQKLEKKLQQFRSRDGGPDTGGTLKIYGESLCQDVPYKTLLLSIRDCAQAVVREMLSKYGLEKADPLHYCLVQVNCDGTEYILDDDECPLSILMNHPTSRVDMDSVALWLDEEICAEERIKRKTLRDNSTIMGLSNKREQIPIEEFETNNIDVDFESSPMGQHCRSPPHCANVNSKYRTFDGTCNNPLPRKSMWGAAGQPMERLLPPAYEDGVWLPRAHGVDGTPLTGAREISRTLLIDANRPHPKYNLLVMQFGQFLAHDITQSASIRSENGESVECCTPDGSGILPPHKSHFACMPIPVEPQDEFYSDFNQRCINFVRLSLSPNSNCKIGYGKQRSKVTHYIDASPVYGSNLQTAKVLRTFRGGRLRMLDDFGRDLLPITNEKEACASNEPGSVCFKSGDGRTNQIISLVAIHILFAREHNRIADTLSQLNPQFTDEAIYQEARRIVIAELQHIVYNEYLPYVIGSVQMKRFRLSTKHHGYAKDYNVDVNPAVTNEFTGAAFRFGHSTVDGRFHLHSSHGIDEVIDIPDVMFNPSRMRKRSFLDGILNTMLNQPMQKVDGSITHGLSRFLFRGANPFGLDLAALNIQRGRDHALRSYNDYLEVSGHRRIHSFTQFPQDIARKLSRVYRHPDDIDLWVGGLLEPHAFDGLVGSTFGEIIADQFSRLKHGDRYFYDYDPKINPGAFTPAQINEIRKSSLARIICDNADHIGVFEVSRSAFVRPDFPGNAKMSCNSAKIPDVDLQNWKV